MIKLLLHCLQARGRIAQSLASATLKKHWVVTSSGSCLNYSCSTMPWRKGEEPALRKLELTVQVHQPLPPGFLRCSSWPALPRGKQITTREWAVRGHGRVLRTMPTIRIYSPHPCCITNLIVTILGETTLTPTLLTQPRRHAL